MISNKKGQTLILFIILIPLILGVMALVVDVGLVFSRKANLSEITKVVIKDCLNKNLDEEEVKELLIKNDIDIENLELKLSGNRIEIKNKIEVDSIFGGIIGLKKYDIKINMTGYKENDKIVID